MVKRYTAAETYIAITRITLGFIFLWAFFDKLFGLGFATSPGKAWIDGVSPTVGFLSHAVTGPFANWYHALAGNWLVDWLFMLGLLGIGLAFVFGVALKFAGYAGALLVALMYLSLIPPKQNPLVDEHIIYAFLLLFFATTTTKRRYSLDNVWQQLSFVKRYPLLQ